MIPMADRWEIALFYQREDRIRPSCFIQLLLEWTVGSTCLSAM